MDRIISIISDHVWIDGTYKPAIISVDRKSGRIIQVINGHKEISDSGSEVLLCKDTYILPGIIDCHTHTAMGGPGGDMNDDVNDPNHFVTPFFRAIDATDIFSEYYYDAEKAGINMVCVLPGSRSVVGGQAGVVLTGGNDPFRRIISENVGMKVALGARPLMYARAASKSPQTKMAVYQMLKESYLEANSYSKKQKVGRDLGFEGWSPVMEGKAPLRVHCHRADDILKAIKFTDEQGLKLVIEHGTEALEVSDEIIKRDIPVVCTNTIYRVPQIKEEQRATPEYASELMKKGVRVALSTNFPEVAWDALYIQSCECLKNGVPYSQVISSLTEIPAQIIGLDKETGSIEEGKWADLSFWSGKFGDFHTLPLGVMTHGELRIKEKLI